jgi:hypothetical protein
MVEYALARALIDDDIKPDYLLASSMGIYAAAAVDPREVARVPHKAGGSLRNAMSERRHDNNFRQMPAASRPRHAT